MRTTSTADAAADHEETWHIAGSDFCNVNDDGHTAFASDLQHDLTTLGVRPGMTIMMHGSLRSLGFVVGGPHVVIRSLIAALGPDGTLIMPAFSPSVSDPATWLKPPTGSMLSRYREEIPSFDRGTTPSEMGALSETFRCWPGTLRSRHPQVSVTARGPLAEFIVRAHPDEWGEGAGSPFERIARSNAYLLLIGVGFNRATMLHYAESLAVHKRRKVRRFPADENGRRRWVEVPDVGDDLNTHFPAIGKAFIEEGAVLSGSVGSARCTLTPIGPLVSFATVFLENALTAKDNSGVP